MSGSDGQIYLWELGEGERPPPKPPLRLDGIHTGGALGVMFNADGSRLLSFGVDDTVRVWDEPFAFRAREFRGHSQGVRAAVFAPDGRQLASAGADGAVRLWRIQAVDFLTPSGNGLIDLAVQMANGTIAQSTHSIPASIVTRNNCAFYRQDLGD